MINVPAGFASLAEYKAHLQGKIHMLRCAGSQRSIIAWYKKEMARFEPKQMAFTY